jgi:hypothetical protein
MPCFIVFDNNSFSFSPYIIRVQTGLLPLCSLKGEPYRIQFRKKEYNFVVPSIKIAGIGIRLERWAHILNGQVL